MAQYLFPCVLITLPIICEPKNNPAQNFSILSSLLQKTCFSLVKSRLLRDPAMYKFQANPVPKNSGILQNPVPEIPGLKILDPAGAWS